MNVIRIEERNEGKVTAKFIYVETTLNKCKCPKCGKFTFSGYGAAQAWI